MLYIYRLTIPASTTESAKERLDFELPYGVINRVEVAFPPGPMGLAHLQIFHDEYQLFPNVPGEAFAWDNVNIAWPEEYQLLEAWNNLSLQGWNEDDTYEHTVTVRFAVGSGKWNLADLRTVYLPLDDL